MIILENNLAMCIKGLKNVHIIYSRNFISRNTSKKIFKDIYLRVWYKSEKL